MQEETITPEKSNKLINLKGKHNICATEPALENQKSSSLF